MDVTKNHLLVMDPATNTMLSGPNAPTTATLKEWLKSHPTFHVIMPSAMPTSKFYSHRYSMDFHLGTRQWTPKSI